MPRLISAAPQLFTRDMAAAVRWFAETLGFSAVFVVGDPPFYAQVRRDDVRLNLRFVDESLGDPARRQREALLSAYLVVDDLEGLHAELTARHVAVSIVTNGGQPPYFLVTTPDGELLCFAAA